MFCLTAGQSSSVWSRVCPRQLKVPTTSTIFPPSSPYRMNFNSPHLTAISTYLCLSLLSVVLFYLSVHLCLNSLASVIWIWHRSHIGSGSGPSCKISTFDFQCQHMKWSLSLPGLFYLARHTSTGHSTGFKIRGKDTTYVSEPPPPASNPLLCGRTIQCDLSMWWLRDYYAIVSPYSTQLNQVLFLYPKVPTSPVALIL